MTESFTVMQCFFRISTIGHKCLLFIETIGIDSLWLKQCVKWSSPKMKHWQYFYFWNYRSSSYHQTIFIIVWQNNNINQCVSHMNNVRFLKQNAMRSPGENNENQKKHNFRQYFQITNSFKIGQQHPIISQYDMFQLIYQSFSKCDLIISLPAPCDLPFWTFV